jgi:hypothetical protein
MQYRKSILSESPQNQAINEIVPVAEVQKHCVQILQKLGNSMGLRFVLADLYTDPRPKFWCCGATLEQKVSLIEALVRCGLSIAIQGSLFSSVHALSRFYWLLQAWGDGGFTSIHVFRTYAVNGAAHGQRSGITIEFPIYSKSTDEFISPTFSAVQKSIQSEKLNRLPTLNLHGNIFPAAPNLVRLRGAGVIPEGIDLVYTWVNGDDPEWLSRRLWMSNSYRKELIVEDAESEFRFRSRNELLYSLRSALTFFLGLGKIYIVTDGQIPAFLALPHEKVIIVDHREIFRNKSHLPTFNSHAIEAQIHRIEGLSSKFLYLNDDFFFGRPVNPFLFFDEYNRSRLFYTSSVTIPDGHSEKTDRGVDAAAKNARDILYKKFGVYVTRKFKHAPVAIIKDVVVQMENEFPNVFEATSSSRFRSFTDVCVSGSFYFHYASLIGCACEGHIEYDYLDPHSPDFITKLKNLPNLDTFCINDGSSTEHSDENEIAFRTAMDKFYPVRAPFEHP